MPSPEHEGEHAAAGIHRAFGWHSDVAAALSGSADYPLASDFYESECSIVNGDERIIPRKAKAMDCGH